MPSMIEKKTAGLRRSRLAHCVRSLFALFSLAVIAAPAAGMAAAGENAPGKILNDWARINKNGALEIVSRRRAGAAAFSDDPILAGDDRVVVALLNHGENSAQALLSEKTVRDDGMSALYTGKKNDALRFDFAVEIDPEHSNHLRCRVKAEVKDGDTPPPERAGVTLGLSASLLGRPILVRATVDGKEALRTTELPVESSEYWHFRSDWHIAKNAVVTGLEIPLNRGRLVIHGIRGPVWFTKPGKNAGHILLRFPDELPENFGLALDFYMSAYPQTPLALAPVANRPLAAALDRPKQDLPAGEAVFGNIRFAIGDGDNALVLRSAPGEAAPVARLEVKAEKPAAWLYLLHAVHGAKPGTAAGKISVVYADGKRAEKDIVSGENVGDRATVPNPDENPPDRSVVWTRRDADGSRSATLYLTRVRLENSPVAEIAFHAADAVDDAAVEWLVAGVTLAREAGIPFHPTAALETPFAIEPGDDWAVMPRYSYFTVPGSALDMRSVTPLHTPAGKFGPVQIGKNGDFVFRDKPDAPVHFLGGNLSSESALPPVDQIEPLAEAVAALGYNAIRFHHHDEWLMKPGAEFAVDPDRLDRFFRTFAAFKARGIYSTLDLYVSRASGFGDPVEPPERKLHLWTVKQRALYDPKWRDNIAQLARIVLATPNPHTGLALKDDPALIHINVMNENSMMNARDAGFNHPYNGKVVQQYYKDFCAKHNLDPKDFIHNWERCRLYAHQEEDKFWKGFLKEIGCDRPWSNGNSSAAITSKIAPADHDYSDVHGYYDHPVFVVGGIGGGGGAFDNDCRNPLAEHALPFSGSFQSRHEGKTLTLTEWHFCSPNPYRSVSGAYMGAAAGFQNSGAIYDFNTFAFRNDWFKYNNNRFPFHSFSLVDQFDLFSDPISLLSNRIPAFFFARGDVKPAEREMVVVIPRTFAGRPYEISPVRGERSIPSEVGTLLFLRRLAMRIDDNLTPPPDSDKDVFSIVDILSWRQKTDADPAKPQTEEAAPKGGGDVFAVGGKPGPIDLSVIRRKLGLPPLEEPITSPGGQIAIDPARGALRVVTEGSEALSQPEGDNSGKRLSVRGNTVFSTVFAGSLDGQSLAESGRVLIMHLTDVKPSDGEFRWYGDKLRTYNRGGYASSDKTGGVKLMRRGKAHIGLAAAEGRTYRLHALNINGERLFEVPFERADGRLEWLADNYAQGQCIMAYELTAE